MNSVTLPHQLVSLAPARWPSLARGWLAADCYAGHMQKRAIHFRSTGSFPGADRLLGHRIAAGGRYSTLILPSSLDDGPPGRTPNLITRPSSSPRADFKKLTRPARRHRSWVMPNTPCLLGSVPRALLPDWGQARSAALVSCSTQSEPLLPEAPAARLASRLASLDYYREAPMACEMGLLRDVVSALAAQTTCAACMVLGRSSIREH